MLTLKTKKQNDSLIFAPKDIVRLQSSSCYTTIFFSNRKKITTCEVLHVYEASLASSGFIRIHRTHLINAHCITKIDTRGNIYLSDGSILTIARRRKKEVLTQLKEVCEQMIIAA